MDADRLSTIEKDLHKILKDQWKPGGARMYFVRHTAAFAGKYPDFTAWVKALEESTENKERWLWRVVGATKTVLDYGEKFYPAIPPATRTRLDSIERYLNNFEKAKVAAIYEATRLAGKTENEDYIRQALEGEITQSRLKELIAEWDEEHGEEKAKKPRKKGSKRDGDSEAGEGGDETARATRAPKFAVSLNQVKTACAQLNIQETAGLTLLRLLKVPIKHDEAPAPPTDAPALHSDDE